MADDVEMIPVDASEPPKANPLAAPAAPKVPTHDLNPVARKPVPGGTQTAALKPGLRLPTKPGMPTGLKLPPKPGLSTAGLKLPPKPATVTAALKPGLKLPTATMKPGVRLPPKPVIRKPGSTVTAAPLPKPVTSLAAAKPAAPAAAPSSAAPVSPAKPVAVDAQGVGKLPTVSAKAVDRADAAPAVSANPNPLEALKSVTQKLKGITQEIPQQAILRKTGIIAEGAMSEAQKEAAKHKTARISLSDAMGVAPVKDENAPMKTIRIKRPVDISGVSKPTAPSEAPGAAPAEATESPVPVAPTAAAASTAVAPTAASAMPTVTQRKTLKISRPGGAVRPSGKFGVKRPSQATTIAKAPADNASEPAAEGEAAPVAEITDIPEMPAVPLAPAAPVKEESGIAVTLSALVQLAACFVMGALVWFLYENAKLPTFCGGLGWQ